MKICLSIESYNGVDGSSISETRCRQMVSVYEMLEEMGNATISYTELQEAAESKKLFGNTKAKNAIRTFFPLLKKIGFVDYSDQFVANRCFKAIGVQFVLACRALNNVTDDTPNKAEVEERLKNIKRSAQKQGLINMFGKSEYRSHNIWIALRLLKVYRSLHWNEFLYTLYCLENGMSFEDALADINVRREEIRTATFVNEENQMLPNTCYSYLRSYLEEAGLIYKESVMISNLTEDADLFYSQIDL